jgi:hypothetical protein
MPNPRIHVVRVPAEELTDAQIDQLMAIGRREADLIDEIEAAVRADDRALVWQLAQALCELEAAARSNADGHGPGTASRRRR